MTEHFIQAHKGKDHVSSDDDRSLWACLLGKGRHIAAGWEEELALSVPSSNTLHIGRGYAFLDGGWYRISGSGEDVEIPPGSIGVNRKDRVFLVYTRGADDVERVTRQLVPGTPTTGTPISPANEHPGNILDGDATVWIPLCDLPVSGLTVGKPVMLLGKRALSPPAQQCEQCDALFSEVRSVLSECIMATTRALEVIRSVPAELAEMHKDIADMHTWLEEKQAQNEAQIRQLAAMLANNIAAYVMVGDTLAVPSNWIEYDPETETATLAYTSYNDETGEFSIDTPLTVDKRVEAVRAEVDYLLMISGEE